MVKNIVANSNSNNTDIECIPVFYKNNAAYKVQKPIPGSLETLFGKAQKGFQVLFEKLETVHNKLLGESVNTKFRAVNVLKSYTVLSVIFLIRVARYASKYFRALIAGFDRGERVELLDGDVIVMLDASWQKDTVKRVAIAKSQGCKVVCVIHDLIAYTHPHLFDERLVENYNLWLNWIMETADGYMAVSKTTRDIAKNLFSSKLPQGEFVKRWFDYFYLGSELNPADGAVIRKSTKCVFESTRPVYLMVSTIEPRKNHQYLLDAFTELWDQGNDLTLCIVGRIGWKCEPLLKQIYSHTELNSRLIMLNDLNDNELEYAYQHSKALVFSSVAEGFGLPIVEAMQRGLPVMASNIPVFREVGGDYAAYFELDDHNSLCELIMKYESTGNFPSVSPLTRYEWLTWKQATEKFLWKIRKHVES